MCKKEIYGSLEQAIGPDQFAYKKNCNSTLALIECQHYWLNSSDKKSNCVRVFSLNFSKAFDTVSQRIVCNKVKDLEINPYVINWLIDFLSNRKQRVAVDGKITEFLDINHRVPQGTVLGPVLFSVMVNDISPVEPNSCQLVKFADDISLSIPIREGLIDTSPLEANNLINWSTQNNMTLNHKKTWEMVIQGKSKKPVPEEIPNIERREELKLLGVFFNENPTNWDKQLDTLLSKASSRLYTLRVCKFYGYSLKELTMLYNSLIASLFNFGIKVWATAFNAKYLSRIDKFNKKAYKYRYTSNLITINDKIKERDRKLWDSIVDDQNHILYDLLPPQRDSNGLRSGRIFILPRDDTEHYKNIFINRCSFNFI